MKRSVHPNSAYLQRLTLTPAYVMVSDTAERQGWQLRQTLAGRGRIEYLWKEQEGRCVVCGQPLRIAAEDLHVHHRIWRSRGGPDTADNSELLHVNCHRQVHVQERLTKAAASCEGRS